MEARVVSGTYRGQLVESPVYDADADCLWFVDVLNCVGRCLPRAGSVRTWAASNWVGCVALRERGSLLAAMAVNEDHSGGELCALTLPEDTGAVCEELAIVPLPLEPSSCPNDGAVDARGRFWVGSKTRLPHGAYRKDAAGIPSPEPGASAPAGRLFVVEEGAVRRCDEAGAVTVSNGIGWTLDGSKMYYVDSPARCVFVFDYDVATGVASSKRLFADLSVLAGDAVPDGVAVDVDGGVWVAMWNGCCVAHLSASGELVNRVTLPVSRPTSVAFGRGTELYITTCSFDAGDPTPLQEPQAGAIFVVDAGVAGVPVARCRI